MAKKKKDDSGEKFVTPAQQAALFRTNLFQEAKKGKLFREHVARRNAALEKLGLRRDEPEAIIERVRRHFPDQTPERLGALHPDRFAWWLERVIEIEAGQAGKPPAVEETAAPRDAMSKKARALAILYEHPEWSDARIADAAGCNRTTLYKWPDFTAARALLEKGRENRPRGEKSADGDVEAWE